MILPIIPAFKQKGYIAGTESGIVTVGGVPASRKIVIMNTTTLEWEQSVVSLPNGHYLIRNLNPAQKYLLICRDYKGEYEPYAWDFVSPKADKTMAELDELWQSMQ